MIPYVLRLARWEWFKQRRRWLPWVLLAILMLIPQVAIWGAFASYASWRPPAREIVVTGPDQQNINITCDDVLRADVPEWPQGAQPNLLTDFERDCHQLGNRVDEYAFLSLPNSLIFAVQLGVSVGLLLVMILTASLLGTEYGWGTLRNVLARGTGRGQLLAGKGALLVMLALGGLLGLMALTAVSSLIATAIVDAPPEYIEYAFGSDGRPRALSLPSPGWLGALETLGRAWFAFAPYIALSALATVFTGSATLGQALSIGYYVAEQIVTGIMSSLVDWFDTVGNYLLGQNIAAWLSGTGDEEVFLFQASETSLGELHAALVLAAYIVGLSGLALWRFSRRDVGGASGG